MRRNAISIIGAVLIGSGAPAPATAEQGLTLEEVVVTAKRRDAAASEFSSALAVVTRDELQNQLLLTDALAELPGVFLQQTTPGQGTPIIRGQRGSSVLHLVDGLRLNNAIFRSAPTQYFALVPVSAIDHVEIVRGTPASLYGSDAVGGIVQAVTRIPAFDSTQTQTAGEVHARYESAGIGRNLHSRFDLGNRRLAASLSLDYVKTGDRRIGGGERIGPTGYESRAGRLALAASPHADRRWVFDLHYLEQPSTPRIDELVAGFGQDEPSSSEFFFEPNRRIFAHLRRDRTDGAFGLDWRMSLAWQRIDDDRRTRNLDADERQFEDNRSDLYDLLVTAGRMAGEYAWIAGFEAYRDRVSSSRSAQSLVDGTQVGLTPRFPDGATLDRAAVFVNGDYALTPAGTLSGGLRLASVDVDVPRTPVTSATTLGVTDLAGDLGWRYDLTDTWQLLANAGYGFRAPNVFDLGTFGNRPGNRFNVPNTALESERAIHADVGIRRHGERLSFELFAWTLDYEDRITSVLTGETTPDGRDIVTSANAGESRIHGVEAGASILLGPAWRLRAVVNYTRGSETLDGVEEPADRIPPLSGRLVLHYDSGGPLAASAWLNAAGEQDRLSARDVRDVRIDPNGTPGWTIAGFDLRWQSGSWQFTAGVDNVFDRRYRRHGSGIDASGYNLTIGARYAW